MSKTEDSASGVSEGNPESLNNQRGDVILKSSPGGLVGWRKVHRTYLQRLLDTA